MKIFKSIAFFLVISMSLSAAYATTLVYPLSKDSTPEHPQEFYCTATKIEPTYPGDTVFMTNYMQMIKGFWSDGNKMLSADELNEVYFQAYHDSTLPFPDAGYVTLTAGTYEFKCFDGTGGRKLVYGPFR
jgi:hypothetical protein